MVIVVFIVVMVGLNFVVKMLLVYLISSLGICSGDGWEFIDKNIFYVVWYLLKYLRIC